MFIRRSVTRCERGGVAVFPNRTAADRCQNESNAAATVEYCSVRGAGMRTVPAGTNAIRCREGTAGAAFGQRGNGTFSVRRRSTGNRLETRRATPGNSIIRKPEGAVSHFREAICRPRPSPNPIAVAVAVAPKLHDRRALKRMRTGFRSGVALERAPLPARRGRNARCGTGWPAFRLLRPGASASLSGHRLRDPLPGASPVRGERMTAKLQKILNILSQVLVIQRKALFRRAADCPLSI